MRTVIYTLLIVTPLLAATRATADVKVGRRIPTDKRVSVSRINHSTWDKLLAKYVNEQGQVDYKAWKANAVDMRALDTYLVILSHGSLEEKPSREGQLAFWINAYNAVTIDGILREYPTSSIRNHTAKVFGYNIWHDLLLTVGDTEYSLDDIEHKILRKLEEPRIHFAIVCASTSCPKLLNEAYTPTKLEQQLTRNTLDFFANAQNFRYDATANQFHLSAILDWFEADFGGSQSAMLKSIAKYLPNKQAQQVAAAGKGRVSYLEYDWSLNEQPQD